MAVVLSLKTIHRTWRRPSSGHGSPFALFGDSPFWGWWGSSGQLLWASSFLSYLPIRLSNTTISHPCNFPHIYTHLTLLSLEWVHISFSSHSSALETAALVAASQCQLPLLADRAPHHLLVCISGSYIKCPLNVLWSIHSNLVRTEREKANINLFSHHFSQMNELNIFITLKINYLLCLGQLSYSSCIFLRLDSWNICPRSQPVLLPGFSPYRGFLQWVTTYHFRESGVWP